MIRLNRNKNIGSVIYIVEGLKTEQYILKRIFNELLGYNLMQVSASKDIKRFRSKTNRYSQITVITSKHPQIISLEKYEQYFDEIYYKLAIEHDIDVENSAIYYIFDRDRQSNPPYVIKRLINKYSNAYDNNEEMNGLLLLSYPSIEAYYLNGHNSKKNFGIAKDIKRYSRKLNFDSINEATIKNASKTLLYILKNKFNIDFSLDLLDDFKWVNEEIFNKEEECFSRTKEYITISCLSFSLLDLGILEIR